MDGKLPKITKKFYKLKDYDYENYETLNLHKFTWLNFKISCTSLVG